MVGTVYSATELDVVQYYLHKLSVINHPGVIRWLFDRYENGAAMSDTLYIPIPEGSDFPSANDIEVWVRDHPIGTTLGCDPGFHRAEHPDSFGVLHFA